MIPREIEQLFPQHVRDRGGRYFLQGRVVLVEVTPERVRASVRGTEWYDVAIFFAHESERVTLSCTCPFFADTGICKHLWAVILQVRIASTITDEEQPRAPDRPSGRAAYDARLRAIANPSKGRPSSANRAAKQSSDRVRHSWKRALEPFQRSALDNAYDAPPPSWPSNRELAYHIDLDHLVHTGELTVEVKAERLESKKGKGRFALTREVWLRAPDERDREIAQLLLGAGDEFGYRDSYFRHRFVIPPESVGSLLPRLCSTGRCRYTSQLRELTDTALRWDDGAPWELRFAIQRDETAGGWRLLAKAARGEVERPCSEALAISPSALIFWPESIARYDAGPEPHARALMVPALEHLLVPNDDLTDLAGSLHELAGAPPIELPPEVHLAQSSPLPQPRLRLVRPKDTGVALNMLVATLDFLYDDTVVPYGTLGRGVYDRAQGRLLHRRLDLERNAYERLLSLGATTQFGWATGSRRLALPAGALESAVLTLTAEGWHVEAEGALYRRPATPTITVRSGVDWFDVEGYVDFGQQRVPLPRLLAALRRGEHTVRLDDGSQGMLPSEWLSRYAGIASLGTIGGDGIRFSRAQATMLDALLAVLPEARVDEAFERIRTQLQSFEAIQPGTAPDSFAGELRPYQRDALGWMDFLRRFGLGGCLADDMGLGKTVQVLALLEARRLAAAGPSLVVVPRSLIFNWRQEAERFTPAMRVRDYSGQERRTYPLDPRSFDLLLTTYGTLRRDVAELRSIDFDYLVLDEAQAIKNAGTASAKAARLLRGRQRLALTGTPIENRLSDLWSVFEFLNPGMLGAASAFGVLPGRDSAAAPDAVDGRTILARALRPFILRRTKEAVAKDLPPKVEQTLFVELQKAQRTLYDELRDHYRQALLSAVSREGIKRVKLQVLEALLRLRQAACHPGLIDAKRSDDPSAKLDALIPQLVEVSAEGHKALVFSQFTSFLALMKPKLEAAGITYEYLDGATRDRQARVERFQNDESCRVFLISIKAGGQGLNLTSADYVFILDPWWNPAVEAQAVDRAHRIGQRKRIFAMRLIARDTVEEKVLELQRSKRDLADAILTADQGIIARIGRAELELLLG